jgi:hypothetical protein
VSLKVDHWREINKDERFGRTNSKEEDEKNCIESLSIHYPSFQ